MTEGYCVKCKAKKEIAGGVEEVMKNGRRAIKGKCPTCGVVMFKILAGKASAAPVAPPAAPETCAQAPSKPDSSDSQSGNAAEAPETPPAGAGN